jgi:hypothetical protein
MPWAPIPKIYTNKKRYSWSSTKMINRQDKISRIGFVMPLKPGMARVQMGGKWGYINKEGRVSIAPQFEEADEFFEGLARVKMNDQWGNLM